MLKLAEAEQVVAAVARSGRVLLVSQSLRGRFDFMEAKRACDAGEIGELFLAESHYVHDLRPVYDYSPISLASQARLASRKSSRPRSDWLTSSTRPLHATAATTCSASAMV